VPGRSRSCDPIKEHASIVLYLPQIVALLAVAEASSMAQPPRSLPEAGKFQDPFVTATGERRAQVALRGLETLWFNTGTLCNLTCQHCYIESSPKNDRFVYLTAAEVTELL